MGTYTHDGRRYRTRRLAEHSVPVLGGEIARALSDNTIWEIALGCARLPRREKGIVLGLVRQFEAMDANETAPNR